MAIQIIFPQALDTTGRTFKCQFIFFATLLGNMAFQGKIAAKLGFTFTARKDFVGMFLIFVVVQCLFV